MGKYGKTTTSEINIFPYFPHFPIVSHIILSHILFWIYDKHIRTSNIGNIFASSWMISSPTDHVRRLAKHRTVPYFTQIYQDHSSAHFTCYILLSSFPELRTAFCYGILIFVHIHCMKKLLFLVQVQIPSGNQTSYWKTHHIYKWCSQLFHLLSTSSRHGKRHPGG